MNAQNGPCEAFACRVRAAFGPVGDADVAAEVGLVSRSQIEGDAFNRNPFCEREGGHALAAALGNISDSGCSCVERLSLTACRNRDAENHLWFCYEAAVAGCWRDRKFDMQIRKARLLQVERCIAREV